MHILATSSASLDETEDPVDLGQTPGDLVVLSFTDSDLTGLAAAWEDVDAGPLTLRLASLRDLRHPMSVDLWVDAVARHAKVIVVRLLGGLDWWRYGVERLTRLARRKGIRLAVLPGEDRDDPRLAEASTVPAEELADLLAYFRAGGRANLAALLRRLADLDAPPPHPLPACCAYLPGQGAVALDALRPDGPVVPVIFYRSVLLAADTAPIDALCAALAEQGLSPAPLVIPSFKDPAAQAFIAGALRRLRPAVVVTTTAFASGDLPEADGAPIVQVVLATTREAAWRDSPRGLGASDLAMHVVLPELDGRVLGGVVSFKAPAPARPELAFTPLVNAPQPDRIAQAADRLKALVRLQCLPRGERRVAVLMPDYPGAPGHEGYAVGLDVPESVLALLDDLRQAGYTVGPTPASARALLEGLTGPFRTAAFGNVIVALPPDRSNALDRRAAYHDPTLPPSAELVAFGDWLRARADVVVHMGAHGTLEWLPGKAVALSAECWPERLLGALPVVYPFIVSNPGEAAQAKRRLGAVTLGHLPPPLVSELSDSLRHLEHLVDEYAQADGLDRRRRDRLARLIVEHAQASGLAREAGVDMGDPDRALVEIDAWLCDVKDMAYKDGLHVYGRGECGAEERAGLLAALDGRHVPAGPSGAPARGRRDVIPTGRNLHAADPRTLPTRTAMDMGRLAAEEVVRLHLQEEGEMPRSLVIDLWGSATLRTGGEEIAQGLALMGCVPVWDGASGRVTGVEVQPPAVMGRPRVDVTWRVSGLFRDLFPGLIALLDIAVHAVADRDETDEENPLAAASWASGDRARIFGAAPGAYGTGIEDMLRDAEDADSLGRAYLEATSHAYEGAEGKAVERRGAFAQRVAVADMLLHSGDDPGRDLLEGGADVAHIGGFAAAARSLGNAPTLVALDTSRPDAPTARTLNKALARIVRGRAVNPRFIAGMMRHGPRGAAELAETVDRLVSFAQTTGAVSNALFDAVHDAYCADETVRDFLLRENPAAARDIAERLEAARRRGLWHPRRNDVDHDLSLLKREPLE
ncbi:cobaltochelatase subunit CobN [Novispirillum sp. DQ9]|uniref:cobaltochelatase subunit CobN n=1 Tax=Novispirillum sp. DQ9 TaxID=3398612 RepID=UPI003C7DE048